MGKLKEKAKPDCEYFFGWLYHAYCGNCGKLMLVGGKGITKECLNMINTCPHCDCKIDWSTVEVKQDD